MAYYGFKSFLTQNSLQGQHLKYPFKVLYYYVNLMIFGHNIREFKGYPPYLNTRFHCDAGTLAAEVRVNVVTPCLNSPNN